MSETGTKAKQAAEHISRRITVAPRLGIILGSGLGRIAGRIANPVVIPYSDIPDFPITTVAGHEGNLVCGILSGVPTAVMQGRFHHYEGYRMREVTFPVRVLHHLGAGTLVVTNASGGINDGLSPGDVMGITDHINLMGVNPLVGIGDEAGRDRFIDMTRAYDEALLGLATDAADGLGVACRRGVLAAVSGPCYETPAEIRMLSMLGADAVCMSTVPEVIMARYLGMRVLGLSLVSNKAAGTSATVPSHREVLETVGKHRDRLESLIEAVVEKGNAAGLL